MATLFYSLLRLSDARHSKENRLVLNRSVRGKIPDGRSKRLGKKPQIAYDMTVRILQEFFYADVFTLTSSPHGVCFGHEGAK